jgi:DnaJ-class molecular chaperone
MTVQALTEKDLTLENTCWNCRGEGVVLVVNPERLPVPYIPRKPVPSPSTETCDFCNGTGRIVTEFGEKVLAFVNRHAKGAS